MDQARADTGLSDFGPDHFQVYLNAWCRDLASERLSATGRERLARIAVRNLRLRLRIRHEVACHPHIQDVELPPIVRIMGFPRSGTTLLHNLMSRGAGRRAILRWELLEPLPPPEAATYGVDARIARVQRGVDALRGSEMEKMHWVEATDPEECTWGFYDLSGLMGRGLMGLMPEWNGALSVSGHRQTYEELRTLIQLLLFRNPVPMGGVLVLKSPTDNPFAQTFLDVFPEAQIILTHRDPYRVATSARRIQQVAAAPFLAEGMQLDADDLNRMVDDLVKAADAMVNLDQTRSSSVHHVRYSDLMSDPAEVVAKAWRASELAFDPSDSATIVEDYLHQQRAGGRAAPPLSYAEDGLDPAQLRATPSLSRYQRYFDVPPEEVRVAHPV